MLVFILTQHHSRTSRCCPGTVLVFAGTLLFPERLGLVFSISLVGVVSSAGVGLLPLRAQQGSDRCFKRRYPDRDRWLERQLGQRGIWIVMAPYAFPFLPAHLICYVEGFAQDEA